MKIQSNKYTSFTAKQINKETILKLNSEAKNYFPQEANFIEINPNNKYDIKALLEIANNWIYGMYSNVISYNGKRLKEKELDRCTNKIFALTKQTKDFKIIKSDEILGIMEIDLEKPKKVNLNYIQVMPDNIHINKERSYKNIGTALIKSIRKRFNDKTLSLNPIEKEIEFYKKLGLKEVCKNPLTYEIEPLKNKK